MKNDAKKNFTKLTRRSGISLIVLVITIIVILILAAAVIITLNNNNPIAEANKARYESDRTNLQAVFTLTVGKVMTQNRATVSITAGQINSIIKDVKETTGTVNYTVKNALNSNNASGTIEFDKGDNTERKYYTGKKLPIYAAGDTKWYVDSEGNISLEVAGVKYGEGAITSSSGGGSGTGSGSGDETGGVNGGTTTGSASLVANAPTTYYGQKVTNYTTGTDTIDSQVEWQIFYADTNNIYLIATDYVHYDLLPTKTVTVDETKTTYKLNKSSGYKAYFTNMLSAYKGSEDITDTRLQALNSSYHEYLETTTEKKSENENMKAVAYMLDTSETVWGTFAGEKAEYAIGGPTVEMLMKSYSQKYGVDYRAKATSVTGYQISKNGGANWANYYYSSMLDTSDTQYVISDTNKTYGMWLASPTADGTSSLMCAYYLGYVMHYSHCNDGDIGFRPLVCLNSNVTLKAVTGGFEIE